MRTTRRALTVLSAATLAVAAWAAAPATAGPSLPVEPIEIKTNPSFFPPDPNDRTCVEFDWDLAEKDPSVCGPDPQDLPDVVCGVSGPPCD